MTRVQFVEEVRKQYDLMSLLSRKNDGEVLHLRHKTLERDVVIRCYETPIPAYDFLKTVQHPNIPVVYDTVLLDDGQAVFEEFVDGMTVADILKNGNYTYRGAKKLMCEVCAALCFLHHNNIIHRDIKPENIIVCDSGAVKLVDFNASRRFDAVKRTDTEVLGTVGYAPPEQQGIAQSGDKADIYALGVLLNVMLTGKHPSEALAKGKAGKIVLKCTQIDPKSRFLSVERLIEAL